MWSFIGADVSHSFLRFLRFLCSECPAVVAVPGESGGSEQVPPFFWLFVGAIGGRGYCVGRGRDMLGLRNENLMSRLDHVLASISSICLGGSSVCCVCFFSAIEQLLRCVMFHG